jgi:Uncharacterized conserved protein
MFKLRSGFIFPIILLLSAFLGCRSQQVDLLGFESRMAPAIAPELSTQELANIAEDAYIYGYPLVVMDVTKEFQTSVAQPTAEGDAPINQFSHTAEFPDETSTSVASPNTDTLYSSAWLNVYKEPIVLSLPDTGRRYYLMPLLSAWSDVIAAPGTRTTGNGRHDFLVTGPGWTGSIPAGVQQIKSPTNDIWIVGRTQTNGKEDYGAVRELQRQYRLTPLSAWGTNYRPPVVVPVKVAIAKDKPPVEQVESMSGVNFFKRMAESMKMNPPKTEDQKTIDRISAMAFVPGQTFDPSKFSKEQLKAINDGAKSGLNKIIGGVKNIKNSEKVDGWVYQWDTGRYGTRYLRRAEVARYAPGAILPADTIYPRAMTDNKGIALNGSSKYVLRFEKGRQPPVNAFWSLTMYNEKQNLVKNPLNRFALGNRNNLKYGADGSLEIYIQKNRPEAARVANWLPAPQGNFSLMMRMYQPQASVLKKQWRVPGVRKVDEQQKLPLGISLR